MKTDRKIKKNDETQIRITEKNKGKSINALERSIYGNFVIMIWRSEMLNVMMQVRQIRRPPNPSCMITGVEVGLIWRSKTLNERMQLRQIRRPPKPSCMIKGVEFGMI